MTYPWHTELIATIVDLRDANRLPHAIALTSGAGWGLESLLNRVCMSLLGQPDDADAETLAHPDLRWVVPDGATIKVDQIRQINEFAVQTPQIANRKVAAISEAHLLNDNAANALLKTLEEPPPNTFIVAATTQWGKLLPTIRSRCQRFQPAQSIKAAREWLAEQGREWDEAGFARSGYAPLAESDANFPEWVDGLRHEDLAAAVGDVSEVDLVAWLGQWYRHVLTIVPTMPTAGGRAYLRFSDELVDVRRQIETSNAANSRLLLERLIVLWRKLPGSA